MFRLSTGTDNTYYQRVEKYTNPVPIYVIPAKERA
jgi:hypothetical protein